jgi:MFS family permease
MNDAGYPLRFLAPLCLGCLLNPINSSMIATALVPIGHSLHIPHAQTAWLVASLYLASAIGQPASGALADRFGARLVFLIGLWLVVLGGLLGAVSSSLGRLIVARVTIGCGTSAAYPATMILVRARADQLGLPTPRSVLAILSIAALASVAIGPPLGGLLASAFGWQSIFLINLPLAVLGFLLAAVGLPRTQGARRHTQPFDFVGLLLFSCTLCSLLLFLMSPRTRWPFLPSAVLFLVPFVARELGTSQPFLDLRMLKSNGPLTRTYLRYVATFFVIYSVFYGYAPWQQEVRGMSAAQAGLAMLPMTIASALCSLIASRYRAPYLPMVVGGFGLVAGSALLFIVHARSPITLVVAAVVIFGIPQGLSTMSNQVALYDQAPAHHMGAASGLLRTSQYLGAMASSCVIATVYGARITDHSLHVLATLLLCISVPLTVATALDLSLRKMAPMKSTMAAAAASER